MNNQIKTNADIGLKNSTYKFYPDFKADVKSKNKSLKNDHLTMNNREFNNKIIRSDKIVVNLKLENKET